MRRRWRGEDPDDRSAPLLVFRLGLVASKAQRATFLVQVTPFEAQATCRRRHLSAMMRERLFEDAALRLLDEHAEGHARSEQSARRSQRRTDALLDVALVDRVVRSQD